MKSNLLPAILAAVTLFAATAPAFADRDDWRDHERQEWREHEWREHHRGVVYQPGYGYVYAPPPVVYAPPPPPPVYAGPSFNISIPLR
jgi:hypothetical protein